jgi:2-polyprenyl-3-methyl-5-hydroxy-6-metoxy-1,4-benzoquinol methylase
MGRFETSLAELLDRTSPRTLLDVGCGEAVLTHRWAQRPGMERIVGIDLDDPQLHALWEARQAPNLTYEVMKAENLPFADGEFELATAIEVLEHVPDPEHTAAEMARCASRWVLVSVPREPIWRITNMARGAYWGSLGNTPGHLNHWSKRAFVELWQRHGEVVEARSPFPWTMLLVRVG